MIILTIACFRSYLGNKHTAESHRGTEADTKAHGYDFIVWTKVNGNKGQPDYAGCIHGKGNILGLIKISWYVTSLWKKNKNEIHKAVQNKEVCTIKRPWTITGKYNFAEVPWRRKRCSWELADHCSPAVPLLPKLSSCRLDVPHEYWDKQRSPTKSEQRDHTNCVNNHKLPSSPF